MSNTFDQSDEHAPQADFYYIEGAPANLSGTISGDMSVLETEWKKMTDRGIWVRLHIIDDGGGSANLSGTYDMTRVKLIVHCDINAGTPSVSFVANGLRFIKSEEVHAFWYFDGPDYMISITDDFTFGAVVVEGEHSFGTKTGSTGGFGEQDTPIFSFVAWLFKGPLATLERDELEGNTGTVIKCSGGAVALHGYEDGCSRGQGTLEGDGTVLDVGYGGGPYVGGTSGADWRNHSYDQPDFSGYLEGSRQESAHRLGIDSISNPNGGAYAWSGASVSYLDAEEVEHNGLYYRCADPEFGEVGDHVSSAATEPGVGVDWRTVWQLIPTQHNMMIRFTPQTSTDFLESADNLAYQGYEQEVVNESATVPMLFRPRGGQTINGSGSDIVVPPKWKIVNRTLGDNNFGSVDSSAQLIPPTDVASREDRKAPETVSTTTAIDLSTELTLLSIAAVIAPTLASGTYVGQKKIINVPPGGFTSDSAAVAVAAGVGFTTATFTADSQGLMVIWNGTGWDVALNNGAALS